MERDYFIIGLGIGILLMSLIAMTNLGRYQNRIDDLQSEIISLKQSQLLNEQTISDLNYVIELKESSINEKEAMISVLNKTLEDQSSTISYLSEYNQNLSNEMELLEEVVDIVGREEIKNILIAYGKLNRDYTILSQDYDQLLVQYQNLLESTKTENESN
jgi:hypothetical protein